MTALELRRIRDEEVAEVGAITVAAYEPFLAGTEDDYRDRLADVGSRDREAEVWVALDDGRLLGNVTLCPPGSPWRELANGDEGEFRMLAVSPEAQRRGVGRALVSLALDRFRCDGAGAVVLCSLATMTAAHHVYGALGFDRTPERDWALLPGVDLIAFRKDLR